jgi:hypothetical protein
MTNDVLPIDKPQDRFLIGSEAHKQLFCKSLVDSHEAYDPQSMPWPDLDEPSLRRLRALPFWQMALQAETNAGAMVSGFGSTIKDPVIRDAVLLQGFEEDRHGRLIASLNDRYGLGAVAHPPQLAPTESAFIHFGYCECLDSFFGFGAFRMAQELEFLPQSLIALFTRVLWEEARHIVFFVNWIAYERVQRGYGGALMQAIATAVGYVRALFDRVMGNRKMAENNTQPLELPPVTASSLLIAALEENDRLMSRFDPRLLRPRVMPALARGILGTIQAGAQVKEVFAPRAG